VVDDRDHRARLAHGRRLLRWARWLFFGALAVLVLALAVGALGSLLGFVDDGDLRLMVVGFVFIAVGFVVALPLSIHAQRLIRASVPFVADGPAGEVPMEHRLGPAHPAVSTWTAALSVPVVCMTVLPFLMDGPRLIMWELLGVATLASFAWLGPSLLGLTCARLDSAGIRDWTLGLRVPWTSVGDVKVVKDGVRLDIAGPVFATGDQPRRWTDTAIAKHQPGSTLHLRTDRPEIVAWMVRRYRGTRPEATDEVRAT
jgi:hypothetical protein